MGVLYDALLTCASPVARGPPALTAALVEALGATAVELLTTAPVRGGSMLVAAAAAGGPSRTAEVASTAADPDRALGLAGASLGALLACVAALWHDDALAAAARALPSRLPMRLRRLVELPQQLKLHEVREVLTHAHACAAAFAPVASIRHMLPTTSPCLCLLCHYPRQPACFTCLVATHLPSHQWHTIL
jgi:hypothetical protein